MTNHTQTLLDLAGRYGSMVRIHGCGPDVADAWRAVVAEAERLDALMPDAMTASVANNRTPTSLTEEQKAAMEKDRAMYGIKLPWEQPR